MRFVTLICSTLLLFSSVFAQDKVNGQDEYTKSIRLVKQAVALTDEGISLSFTWKRIGRLGDGVSIALLKIYDADALQNPQNIRNYLPVIRTAFGIPKIVRLTENRKPEVTIFLLTYLEGRVKDENLKAQISDVIEFIKEQTSKE
jgi:hypothetical protein